MHKSLKNYSRKLRIMSDEREKMVTELHDGIGGIITNIHFLAEIGAESALKPENKKVLSTISGLSMEGMGEIKCFMQSLDEKDLSWEAVGAEFRLHGSKTLKLLGIDYSFTMNVDDKAGKPHGFVFMNLYRIYREALTNIIKHSKANAVTVNLEVSREIVQLKIQDNGRGFQARGTKGRGLLNMHSRAREIDGTVTIESGSGTCITLRIPSRKLPDPG